MTIQHGLWLGFIGLVLALLVLDLGVLNRKSHALSVREAVTWSVGLVTMALLFGLFVLWIGGTQRALEYYAGYLIELTLSVDNLFVFLLIFQYFAVPAAAQPKVLNFGIFGAMLMRGIMIVLGTLILRRFVWVIYLLGGVLLLTAIKMYRQAEIRIEPERNPLVRLARRFLPVTPSYEGTSFLVRTRAGWMATPLILVVLVVEWSDVMFAIDSIPAIFAVTQDPFIVFSSNIFAILGLRALFFVLADAMDRFVYLKPGVALILGFVGLKMMSSWWFHPPIAVSLGVIVGILGTAIVASVLRARTARAAAGDSSSGGSARE